MGPVFSEYLFTLYPFKGGMEGWREGGRKQGVGGLWSPDCGFSDRLAAVIACTSSFATFYFCSSPCPPWRAARCPVLRGHAMWPAVGLAALLPEGEPNWAPSLPSLPNWASPNFLWPVKELLSQLSVFPAAAGVLGGGVCTQPDCFETAGSSEYCSLHG